MTTKRRLSTVELFAGIGGFRIAADELGIETVFANDIEPVASDIYRRRFNTHSDVHREGDVFDFLDEIPAHDILTGGFPCQPFSFAGKKQGIADRRATTLDAICSVLKSQRPRAFVLENVKSLLTISHGKHFAEVLRQLNACGYSVEWRVFNTIELGLPQNRLRVLLLGTQQPLVTRHLAPHAEWESRAGARTRWTPIPEHARSFPLWGIATDGHFVGVKIDTRCPSPDVLLRDVLETGVPDTYDFTEATLERLATSTRIEQIIDGVEVLWNQEGGRRMGYTIYGVNGAAPTLTCTSSRHYERFLVDGRYRRLTPVEYARIQGFPDDHCREASHGKQYVLYGNAIPPLLARHGLGCAVSALKSLAGSRNRKPAVAVEEVA